jgi:predicted GH43/DUF377 family glycosyl hydrolase
MNIQRTKIYLEPDKNRVLLLPLNVNSERTRRIINHQLNLSSLDVKKIFEKLELEFGHRHKNLMQYCLKRFDEISNLINITESLSEERKFLIGSSFVKEYSVESAALFNPSIVWHPDQSNLNEGERRFILSLRATGEGHISSIEFRSGVLDSNYNIKLDQISNLVQNPDDLIIEKNNYQLSYDPKTNMSERIIFPTTPDESNGIEDARFVQFYSEKDDVTYYATYTAYNGREIIPKLIETSDFLNFRIIQMSGKESVNKGMALFPRKIGNKFAMISRQDEESLYIMFSGNIGEWDNKNQLLIPKYEWETIQIGNCGSPIETKKGWLLLTHGVGILRKYSIGAILLDLEDPTRVIGRLKQPLLAPNEIEREGYVPNVVYSCGSLIYRDKLVMPYALSDYSSSFSIIDLNELLENLIYSN